MYISIPAENLSKLKGLSGRTISAYLALRSLLFYKRVVNGKLVAKDDVVKCSYGDAEKLGISRKTFGRAVKDLVEIGLIEIDRQGGFGKGRRPSRYRIF